ncbi:MAG: hypothetical protein AAFO29_08500 [Actinomycetota bacterium]
MPTKDDFGIVADRLRTLVGELEEVAVPLERVMGPDVLEGGELTDSVYESIKVTRMTGLSLSAVVAEYAAEAERRKEEAIAAEQAQQQYEDDLDAHRRELIVRAEYEDAAPTKINDIRRKAKRMGFRLDEDPSAKPTPPPPPPDYVDI